MAVSSLPLRKPISNKQVSEDPDSAEVENKNSLADFADLRRKDGIITAFKGIFRGINLSRSSPMGVSALPL
jgi:hypothetical protein